MFSGKEITSPIKVIDFGLSKLVADLKETEIKSVVGTPYFVAPEVLKGSYSYKADCWSIGVILYLLLSGLLPFNGTSKWDLFKEI